MYVFNIKTHPVYLAWLRTAHPIHLLADEIDG